MINTWSDCLATNILHLMTKLLTFIVYMYTDSCYSPVKIEKCFIQIQLIAKFMIRLSAHWITWGLLCQKYVSRAMISNCIPQILRDVITYPCLNTYFWHTNPHIQLELFPTNMHNFFFMICFVAIILSLFLVFLWLISCILQIYFSGNEAIVLLPQCQLTHWGEWYIYALVI